MKKVNYYDPYSKVLEHFNRHGIRYVIVGMSAVNYYALNAREIFSTQDYDIFIKPTLENVRKAVQVLQKLEYTVTVDGKAFEIKMLRDTVRMKRTLTAVNPYGVVIELILAVSGFVFFEMDNDASIFNIGKIPIKVGKLTKVLESKKIANRRKDKLFLKRYEVLLVDRN